MSYEGLLGSTIYKTDKKCGSKEELDKEFVFDDNSDTVLISTTGVAFLVLCADLKKTLPIDPLDDNIKWVEVSVETGKAIYDCMLKAIELISK